MATADEFIGKVNKKWGDIISYGTGKPLFSVQRFSSGVFTLDRALGGGWPRGRIILISGPESSGKTMLMHKACASIEKYKQRALFIDHEGTYDESWARTCGMDTSKHLVARTRVAEQASELITAAINEEAAAVIILDSIASLSPKAELEGSMEDHQMGLVARIMNKSLRRWNASLMEKGDKAPTIFLINQPRDKIGVIFGDPTTLPGGKMQNFANSIHVRLRPAKIKDDPTDKLSALHEGGGITKKNKTYTPHMEFAYTLMVRDAGYWRKGEIKNAQDVFYAAKQLELMTKKTLDCKLDADAVQRLHDEPKLLQEWWAKTLEKCYE